ncbi:MAG: PQQ-binding-like beta-propeller repeat protein [Planctomycetota bacterium]
MRHLCILFCFTVLIGCTETPTAIGQSDWPNYRGPNRDNAVNVQGLEEALAHASERLAWRRDIGLGYTVVTTSGGRAYTVGWRDGTATVRCIDPATGEDHWTFDYEIAQFDVVPNWPKSNEGGPVTSPAIADGRVFHSTRDGRVYCLDADDGSLIWQDSFSERFGVEQPRWGWAASPVVIDGVVYFDTGRVVAMRASDGKVLWQTEELNPTSYATVTPFSMNGRSYLAAWPLDGAMVVDRDTGKMVAFYPWDTPTPCHAASPLVFDGDKIFVSMGFNGGGAVLRFTGEVLEAVWENNDMCNTMATSLYRDGHLYGFDQAIFRCVDAKTGEIKWSHRGLGQGSLMAVGDTMLVQSEKGDLSIAPLTPEGYKPGPRVTLLDTSVRVWSCPVISNGRMYLRDPLGELVCIDVSN